MTKRRLLGLVVGFVVFLFIGATFHSIAWGLIFGVPLGYVAGIDPLNLDPNGAGSPIHGAEPLSYWVQAARRIHRDAESPDRHRRI